MQWSAAVLDKYCGQGFITEMRQFLFIYFIIQFFFECLCAESISFCFRRFNGQWVFAGEATIAGAIAGAAVISS
jgi:hypothetical protein